MSRNVTYATEALMPPMNTRRTMFGVEKPYTTTALRRLEINTTCAASPTMCAASLTGPCGYAVSVNWATWASLRRTHRVSGN